MLNLNPNLVNQDQIRLKKRKKLLLYLSVPLILLILLAFFFMRTGIYNILFSINVSNKSYGFPATITGFQQVGNIIEPYLPHYNSGYLKLIQAKSVDDLNSAEADFKESLKANPPEYMLCSVYGNLSYTIELKGLYSYQAKQYNEAIVFYNQAEALLYENNCASKNSSSTPGTDQMSENAKERIEKEREEAVAAANNEPQDGDDDGDDDGDGNDQEITEEQLQQLHQNQQNVDDSAVNSLQHGGSYNHFGDPNF